MEYATNFEASVYFPGHSLRSRARRIPLSILRRCGVEIVVLIIQYHTVVSYGSNNNTVMSVPGLNPTLLYTALPQTPTNIKYPPFSSPLPTRHDNGYLAMLYRQSSICGPLLCQLYDQSLRSKVGYREPPRLPIA